MVIHLFSLDITELLLKSTTSSVTYIQISFATLITEIKAYYFIGNNISPQKAQYKLLIMKGGGGGGGGSKNGGSQLNKGNKI